VKELKEMFVQGEGIENLGRYDVHAICGCIRDLLRSLDEPLICRWIWKEFALANKISDVTQRQTEIDRLVKDLPPLNQDTLAFIILHLQR